MKARMIFGWLVVAAWLCGCSTTKFTAYHGTEVYQGAGGVVLPVEGIDFYESGEPSRKYRIVGMLMEEHRRRVPLGPLGRVGKVFGGSGSGAGEKYAAVAKVARERGGNAVMVLGGGEAGAAGEEEGGRHYGGRGRKFVVVKYVEVLPHGLWENDK